ncbi:MAG: glycosyltransferase family 2 protein [Patescibacteria group bacterium]
MSVSKEEKPEVGIVMPVYNKYNYTKKCLDGIFFTSEKTSFEVVVIDNASTDETRENLQKDERIKYIANQENLGFAKACNQGARESKARFILFLNNDMEPLPGWLDNLVEEIKKDDSIAIAGSKLLYGDGTIQHAGIAFDEKGPYHIYRKEKREKPYVNKQRFLQGVTGASLLIRRAVFEKIGGFDEGFINGYEDVDLCLRVAKSGKKILYCPKSELYHYESMTEGRLDHKDLNRDRLLKKWKGKMEPDHKKILKEDGNLNQFEKMSIENEEFKKENRELKEELKLIKNSKFWKARQKYMNIKNKILKNG